MIRTQPKILLLHYHTKIATGIKDNCYGLFPNPYNYWFAYRRVNEIASIQQNPWNSTSGGATDAAAATTTTTTTTAAKAAEQPNSTTTDTTNISKQVIQRHGIGDACITLNVGGKEFYTLRSTVLSNQVLAQHVLRAEENHEIVKHGAIFIDRDPEYFPLLLKYLRNRIEYQNLKNHTDKITLKRYVTSYIDLPNDSKMLRGLYIEAVYYRMNDLQSIIRESNFMVQMASVLAPAANTNPFDWILKLYSTLRSFLIACSVIGGSYFVFIQNEWNYILQHIGLRKRDRHTKSEIFE